MNENCSLKEQLQKLKEELATTNDNYETIIASKDAVLEERNTEIKELKKKEEESCAKHNIGLRRIASDEEILRLKLPRN